MHVGFVTIKMFSGAFAQKEFPGNRFCYLQLESPDQMRLWIVMTFSLIASTLLWPFLIYAVDFPSSGINQPRVLSIIHFRQWGLTIGRFAIEFLFSTEVVMLTHWGQDKMSASSQTIISNALSWKKMYAFRIVFHCNLFLRFQLTIHQHRRQAIVWASGGIFTDAYMRHLAAMSQHSHS